jgi:hypothetical protein
MSDMDTDYGLLLHRFLAGALSAEDFQRAYLERFKNESRELDDSLFEILDELFGDEVVQASQRLARLQKQTRWQSASKGEMGAEDR